MADPPADLPLDPWDAAYRWRWYRTRLVRGGPWVPASLRVVAGEVDEAGDRLEDDRVVAEVDGAARFLRGAAWPRGWPWQAMAEGDHRHLAALSAWAKANDPDHPLANPAAPVCRDKGPTF